MYDDDYRCPRCDSRYCGSVCHAEEPGYVYAVGYGYVTFREAAEIEAGWESKGMEYGIHHGFARVEWDRATPAANDIADGIRLAALAREAERGHVSLYAGLNRVGHTA